MTVSVLLAGLLIGSYTDLKDRIVPNWLTFGLIFLGVVINTLAGPGLLFSLAGIAAGFILSYPVYLFCGVGAGDAKLMIAVGAFLGFQSVIIIAILSALINGICSMIVLAKQGKLKDLMAFTVSHGAYLYAKTSIQDFSKEEIPMYGKGQPFAVYVALSTIGFLLWR